MELQAEEGMTNRASDPPEMMSGSPHQANCLDQQTCKVSAGDCHLGSSITFSCKFPR